ncbi:MAG: carbamoyltransferase HypF [bacterium]
MSRRRVHVEIRGAVQGVGFRPFVYRLAHELDLAGWVVNDSRGVRLEAEGAPDALGRFLDRLRAEAPPHARLHSFESAWLPAAGFEGFEIRPSDPGGARSVVLLPDLATCTDCLAEIGDPRERRHRYPFTNCTRCGPRFTIVRALPYDRPNTTMRGFALCEDCAREYADPRDRRFHAQPVACPRCGPSLVLEDARGMPLARGDEALRGAAAAIREGRIVAVKGLGGYHLMCDAANAAAVEAIRERKPRHEKPFALMARDLAQARALVAVDDAAAEVLASSEAPIVLLPRRADAPVAANVAPGLPTLGVMLPATPLHHLLLREVDRAVVATSGNLTDEPIVTGNAEARRRLGHVADLLLAHDRPIERHVDDSVGTFLGGAFRLLRRARGWAPLPVLVSGDWPAILAVGAHLKSTVALATGRQVFVSQHVGDLETPEATAAFERVIDDFTRMYDVAPAAIAHDLHPDYVSTHVARRLAAERGVPLFAVQHHHAHLAAVLAEAGAEGRALGVTWDGTGFGEDGTVWGGEFLLGDASGYERVAHFAPFRLPGGEAAIREPRRTAVALVYGLLGEAALSRTDLPAVASFAEHERDVLARMLERGLNSPTTTSAGRLFDGVAALLGLHGTSTFEGQAAMALEALVDPTERGAYPVTVMGGAPRVLDWRPTIAALLADLSRGASPGVIAARFHNALVAAMVLVARDIGVARVALGGGCFQNRVLVERALEQLAAGGHEVLLPRLLPANDGGISLGQAAVCAAWLARR